MLELGVDHMTTKLDFDYYFKAWLISLILNILRENWDFSWENLDIIEGRFSRIWRVFIRYINY